MTGVQTCALPIFAIDHEEADRVPLVFRQLIPFNRHWDNAFERAEWLEAQGVDDRLTFGLEWFYHPDVTVNYHTDSKPGERYPLLVAEFNTPKGELRTIVRKTDDYDFEHAQLVGDHNISDRVIKHLIETPEDIEKFQYLLYDPRNAQLEGFRQEAKRVNDFAKGRFWVDCLGGYGHSSSEMEMALMGMERVIRGVIDEDPLVLELLEMIDDWYMKRLEVMITEKPDTICVRPLYETTDFWSLDLIRKHFFAPLRTKAKLLNQAGIKLHCYTVTGVMPILDIYKEAGVDLLWGCDPLPNGDADLAIMKKEIGHSVCLMGGLNPTHTVECGTREQVCQETIQALNCCAKGGGFILSPAGSIWEDSQHVYDNVMAVIHTCLEYGKY